MPARTKHGQGGWPSALRISNSEGIAERWGTRVAETGGEPKRRALIRIVAGMLHTGFDALWRRERRRRARRNLIAAVGLAAILAIGFSVAGTISEMDARKVLAGKARLLIANSDPLEARPSRWRDSP